jgi:uncharacterized membrane protein SpoIIM required for sporulation
MDYGRFVARGEPDWRVLEDLLKRVEGKGLGTLDHDGLDELAARHRRVIGDFAWARSHFPGSAAERRLRPLAFAGHRLLAELPEPVLPRVIRFFREGFPAAFREALPLVGLSLAVFLGGCLMGYIAVGLDRDAARLIFDEATLETLRRGEIWTDSFESVAGLGMATGIFLNNIRVGILCWAGGVVGGLFTVLALVQNGMMVGAMLSICQQYELTDRLFAFTAAHGPLELFLIVVCGAAGFSLARGLLMDQNIPRAEAIAQGARRSWDLAGGTLPWFVLLGLIEGNLSPQMSIATGLKAVVGFSVMGLFLLYGLGARR